MEATKEEKKICVKCGGLFVIMKASQTLVSGDGSMEVKLFQFASPVAPHLMC